MNKKLLLSGISVCLLIFSLVLAGCGDGAGDGDGGGNDSQKNLKVTNISNSQLSEAGFSTNGSFNGFNGYGLFPPGTSKADVTHDASAFLNQNATTKIVAGNNTLDHGDELVTTGSSNNYTTTVRLRGANAAYSSYWTGSGSYDIWILLYNGSGWTFYKSNSGISITESTTTLDAQADFCLQ